jgi:hypothetical protein
MGFVEHLPKVENYDGVIELGVKLSIESFV